MPSVMKQVALAWGHASVATRSNKHLVRSCTDHFKRLLEETRPNHAYLVRHKLKNCGMMWSFMTLGSLTWGTESSEGPNGSDAAPFPEENDIMMVLGERPPGREAPHVQPRPRISTHGGGGRGGSRVQGPKLCTPLK
jgi:hypothetical protein